MLQGQDPLTVTKPPPGGPVTTWQKGSTQTVAMGVWANHGGGYAYRLCKNTPGRVNEACFQETHLQFAETSTQWLQHINGTKYEIPMTKFTSPTGSEWVRIPFPTCARTLGNPPGHGFTDGVKGPDGIYMCPNGTEYPEPLLNGQRVGLLGFGYCNHTASNSCTADAYHEFSIVDKVSIPI
jgi:hypothetical protein